MRQILVEQTLLRGEARCPANHSDQLRSFSGTPAAWCGSWLKVGTIATSSAAPSESDCHLPDHEFIWVGYDGSEVVGHRTIPWYNSALGGARAKGGRFITQYPDRPASLLLWGVGNHGGGPSHKDLVGLSSLIAGIDSTEIRHSTPREAYFADLLETSTRHPASPWARYQPLGRGLLHLSGAHQTAPQGVGRMPCTPPRRWHRSRRSRAFCPIPRQS